MKEYFALLMMIFASCSQDDTDEVCTLGFKPTTTIEMNAQVKADTTAADVRTVTLLLGKFTSPSFPKAESVADSALHIASVLLSSHDFKTVIASLDFTCRNYGHHCKKICKRCSDRFSGRVVLDSVYREKQARLDLFLRNCRDEYGHATFNIREVYSCQPVVFYDEKKLSPAYCYAYHLAHEYMHIVGFFHTDHVDDVAEKTGWLGWEILLRWQKAGLNVMQMQPGDHYKI